MHDQNDRNNEVSEERSPHEKAFEKIMKEINDKKQENDEDEEKEEEEE